MTTTGLFVLAGTPLRPLDRPLLPAVTIPAMADEQLATYRGATREDAERQYHEHARTVALTGYVPVAEEWSTALGQQVLTVRFAHDPGQASGVLKALDELRSAPASSAVDPTSAGTSSQMALGAGLAWLAAAALTAFLAFEEYSAYQELAALGQAGLGLNGVAIENGIAAVITAFFAVRCFQRPGRGFWSWSIVWAVVNVGFGVAQVAGGVTYWVFFLVIIATGVAGFLSFVAWREAR